MNMNIHRVNQVRLNSHYKENGNSITLSLVKEEEDVNITIYLKSDEEFDRLVALLADDATTVHKDWRVNSLFTDIVNPLERYP